MGAGISKDVQSHGGHAPMPQINFVAPDSDFKPTHVQGTPGTPGYEIPALRSGGDTYSSSAKSDATQCATAVAVGAGAGFVAGAAAGASAGNNACSGIPNPLMREACRGISAFGGGAVGGYKGMNMGYNSPVCKKFREQQ